MIEWRKILSYAAMLFLLALIFVVVGLGWLLVVCVVIDGTRWCARRLGHEWGYILWALVLIGGVLVIVDLSDRWQDDAELAVAWIVAMFVYGWAVNPPPRNEPEIAEPT